MKENKTTCFSCGAKLTEETDYSFDGRLIHNDDAYYEDGEDYP